MVLELGPLEHEELAALLTARTESAVPAALAKVIVARSEGNPFFAEELLAAAGDASGELPRRLRDLLLRRLTRLDRRTQALLRMAAAAGRDVAYPLLCAGDRSSGKYSHAAQTRDRRTLRCHPRGEWDQR